MTVRLHPEAEDELAEAAAWHEARVKGLGFDLMQEAARAFDAISRAPSASQLWPDAPELLGIRRYVNDEEEGIRNALESLRRGEGIPYEVVKAELERLLRSEVTPPSSK